MSSTLQHARHCAASLRDAHSSPARLVAIVCPFYRWKLGVWWHLPTPSLASTVLVHCAGLSAFPGDSQPFFSCHVWNHVCSHLSLAYSQSHRCSLSFLTSVCYLDFLDPKYERRNLWRKILNASSICLGNNQPPGDPIELCSPQAKTSTLPRTQAISVNKLNDSDINNNPFYEREQHGIHRGQFPNSLVIQRRC